ncbi:MAG TPA: carbonic anhydrase [Bryobacteraceae bacterium]
MLRTSVTVLLCSLAGAVLATGQRPAACPVSVSCPVCDPARTAGPLTTLREGNGRFVNGHPRHFHQSVECGKRLSCCQKPFAVILSCSDSRVSPNVLFDQGIGDLFVIRVAGNVATPDALGSIEYAVDHFGAKLVVVMGHQRCGAVQAAFCPRPGPHLDVLWDLIRPSVTHPLHSCEHHEQVDPAEWDLAVKKNASNMAAIVARDLHSRAGVKVVAAYYSLDTGKVNFSK